MEVQQAVQHREPVLGRQQRRESHGGAEAKGSKGRRVRRRRQRYHHGGGIGCESHGRVLVVVNGHHAVVGVAHGGISRRWRRASSVAQS